MTPTTVGLITEGHPSPIDAIRVVDNRDVDAPSHAVEISLTHVATRDLLKALARRVFIAATNGHQLRLREALREEGTSRLMTSLGDHWLPVWTLTADDATALGNHLLDCAEEPFTCDCGRFVDLEGDGETTCSVHHWTEQPRIGA